MTEPTGAGFELLLAAHGDLSTQVKKVSDRLERISPKTIIQGKRVFGVGTIASQSPTSIYPTNPPDGPAPGLVWNVRAVALTGITDAHTAVTGVTAVEFYCGQQEIVGTTSAPITANFPDLIPGANASTAPAFSTLTRHLIWAQSHDMPYAMVYGGTAGTQVFFLAIVEEWDIDEVWKMSIGKR